MDADQLASRLADWPGGRGPLYGRLGSALMQLVRAGELADGTRLPAERQLADALAVSRTTVAAAYARVREAGLIASRQGSGHVVRRGGGALPRAAQLARSLEHNTIFRGLLEPPVDLLDFRAAHLVGTDDLPAQAFREAFDDIEALRCDHGYVPAGLPVLREGIAQQLSSAGVPTRATQVLITSGAQQAISLLAALYCSPGEPVVVEELTFPGAIDAFRAAGARLVPVPVTERGVDIDALVEAVAVASPGLIYLTPSVHNPTGVRLELWDRRRLLRRLDSAPVMLVEDDTLAPLWFDEPPPPPLASLDGGAEVLSIGSFSKLYWGGLRVGWIRGPAAVIAQLARVKAVDDLGTSLPSQAIAARLLAHAADVGERRRATAVARQRRLIELLAAALPQWSFTPPRGGLCLWVRLPFGSAAEYTHLAARHGVAIAPGSVSAAVGTHTDYLRLPYGQPEAVLEDGVARLAAAWREYQALAGRGTGELQVVV